MTDRKPQKEYIITETLIRQWRGQCMNISSPHTNNDDCKKCEFRGKGKRENCCDLDDSDFEKMFRSHPTPSPKFTKNCMCDKYTNCTDCQQHDTSIRNAALDDVIKIINNSPHDCLQGEDSEQEWGDQPAWTLKTIEKLLKSLRTPTKEAQQR